MSKTVPNCNFISLFHSIGEKPLDFWSKNITLKGKIQRIKDDLLKGDKVIEILGPYENTVLTSITCPAKPMDFLQIKLPILVLVVRNLDLRFKFELQILDNTSNRRRFTFKTYHHDQLPIIRSNGVQIPLILDNDWNIIEINMQKFCSGIYQTYFQVLEKIVIYPNCRLRRVYLQDMHYDQNDTPLELFQALFDMYLKNGVDPIERGCQTEKNTQESIDNNSRKQVGQPKPLKYYWSKNKGTRETVESNKPYGPLGRGNNLVSDNLISKNENLLKNIGKKPSSEQKETQNLKRNALLQINSSNQNLKREQKNLEHPLSNTGKEEIENNGAFIDQSLFHADLMKKSTFLTSDRTVDQILQTRRSINTKFQKGLEIINNSNQTSSIGNKTPSKR